jgi:hypothetical protein
MIKISILTKTTPQKNWKWGATVSTRSMHVARHIQDVCNHAIWK